MVFGSNLTGLYSGLQPLAAPAKTTTGPFVAAAPAEGMSDTSVALVAGALSGIVADVITHPICTVKARMMVQGAQVTAGEAGAVVYDGLLSGFATILKTEGVGALYSGIGAVCAGAAPAQALFFGGMTATKQAMGDSPQADFVSGLAAQLTGSLAWVPMEVIKEKLMIEGQIKTKESYGSSLALVRKVIATEGIGGIYRGFVMQQVTYGPFNGLAIMFMNQIKPFVPESIGTDARNFAASIGGDALAAVVTNPADVVKTRIQVQKSNPELFAYDGAIDCFLKILKHEGPAALFDGVSGRVGWLAPRCAIAITAFQSISGYLKG